MLLQELWGEFCALEPQFYAQFIEARELDNAGVVHEPQRVHELFVASVNVQGVCVVLVVLLEAVRV